jgi:DNA-binding NarL/FixJ family response regulator
MSKSQDSLTPREMDVLKLLALGLHNKQIAVRLRVNERTIKYHVSAILAKLEVSNRTEAVTEAARRKWISLEEEQA